MPVAIRISLGALLVITSAVVGVLAGPASPSYAAWGDRPDFELPFACGSAARLTTGPTHDNPDDPVWRRDKALDIFNPIVDPPVAGEPVLASASGRVIYISSTTNAFLIDHGRQWFTMYAHSTNRVPDGTIVSRGDRVATVGKVGTGSPHLHYEQRYDADGDGIGAGDELVRPVLHGVEYHLSTDGSPYATTVTSYNCPDTELDPAGPVQRADFNADGRNDVAIFNDMGGGGLRLFIHYGGQSTPTLVWNAPTWGLPITNMRLVTGRFGLSSGTEIAAFVDYGNGRMGVWVFPGLNPGSPFLAIDAPTWGLPINNSRLIGGDLNNDAYTDIVMFSDMGGGHLREHIIYGGQWDHGIRQVWDAPTWGLPVGSMRLVSGHFGYSSGSDVAAFVDYGTGRLGVWVFPGYGPGSPFLAINAPTWARPITSTRVTNGDLNNDGYTDIVMFTNMGGGHLREHIVYGGQWNLGLQLVWDAPSWGLPIGSMRLVSGHFGYSSGSDVAAFVDYGTGRMGVWVFPGYGPGSPFLAINAPTWGRPISSSRFTSGDLNNDSYTDIAMFTDVGGGHLREHIVYGGHWNYGIQQVWDAPTWGFPISSARLAP